MAPLGNPLISFNPHAFLNHTHAPAPRAAPAGTPACVNADMVALGNAGSTLNECNLFATSTLPTVQQVTDCMGKVGLSSTCESCLTTVLTSVLGCLGTCGYNNGEMSQNPSSECITCMTALMSQMQDSNMLATCGIDASNAGGLLGQFSPQSGNSTDTTDVVDTTTADPLVTTGGNDTTTGIPVTSAVPTTGNVTSTTKSGSMVGKTTIFTAAMMAVLALM